MTENNGNSSATTVLITVVIVAIIGAAFYFGFVRGFRADDRDRDINVEFSAPNLDRN